MSDEEDPEYKRLYDQAMKRVEKEMKERAERQEAEDKAKKRGCTGRRKKK